MNAVAADTNQIAGTRALAQATLQYGEAAAKYFAGAALTEHEKLAIADAPTTTGVASLIANAGTNKFEFAGATLLLNDEIDLKLHVDALAAAADYAKYTVKVESELVSSDDCKLVLRADDNGANMKFKVAVEGIPAAAYGADLKITVMEGNVAVSDTLVYSVDAYVSRMWEQSDDLAKHMMKAIVAMGDAAEGVCIHRYGDWTLSADKTKETKTCAICGETFERAVETVTMVYQDVHTFATPVLGIESE